LIVGNFIIRYTLLHPKSVVLERYREEIFNTGTQLTLWNSPTLQKEIKFLKKLDRMCQDTNMKLDLAKRLRCLDPLNELKHM